MLGTVLASKDSAVNDRHGADSLVVNMDSNQITTEINANVQLDDC